MRLVFGQVQIHFPYFSKGTVVTDTVYGLDYDWNTDGTNAGNVIS